MPAEAGAIFGSAVPVPKITTKCRRYVDGAKTSGSHAAFAEDGRSLLEIRRISCKGEVGCSHYTETQKVKSCITHLRDSSRSPTGTPRARESYWRTEQLAALVASLACES